MSNAYIAENALLSMGVEDIDIYGTLVTCGTGLGLIPTSFTPPNADQTITEAYSVRQARTRLLQVPGKVAYNGSVSGWLQNPRLLRHIFGRVTDDAQTLATQTTLDAAVARGSTAIDCSADSYSVGDYIQIGDASSVSNTPEIRQISADAGDSTYTLDRELLIAHPITSIVKKATIDANGTNYVTHTFTENYVPPPSYSLEYVLISPNAGTDLRSRWSGGRFIDASLRQDVDAPLQASFSFNHKDETTGGTAVAVADVTTSPYKFFEGEITYAGAGITRLDNVEWSMESGLDPKYYIKSSNGQYVHEQVTGKVKHSVDLAYGFVDLTEYNKFEAAEFAGSMSWTRTASSDQMTVAWTNMKVRTRGRDHPYEGRVTQNQVLLPESVTVTVADSTAYY